MENLKGKGCGVYQISGLEDNYEYLKNKYLSGAKLMKYWSQLEPEEGKYNWDFFDEPIDRWANAGKKIILSPLTVGEGKLPSNLISGTPSWVFEKGAEYVVHKNKDASENFIPLYSDQIYLEKYHNFIKALASHYNDNPFLEMVQIGMGLWGETIISSGLWEDKPELVKWENKLTKLAWTRSVKKVIDYYSKSFKNTLLCLLISHPGEEYLDTVYEYSAYAASNKIMLQYCGQTQEPFLWNGEFFLKILLKHCKETSIGLEAFAPTKITVPNWGPGYISSQRNYTLRDLVNTAIKYKVNYFTIWYQDLSKATPTEGCSGDDSEWGQDLKRANELLKPYLS